MAMLTEPNQPLIREDLSDDMIIVDMKATPFMTMVKKGPRPENSLFEWPADAYDAAATTSTIDGTAVTDSEYQNPATNRARLQGRVHYRRRVPAVSTLAETLSNVAGVGINAEYRVAVKKKLIELKRDMEKICLGDQDSDADDGSSNGYITRGLGKWIQTSAQSDLPVPAAFRTPTGSIETSATASLTEGDVQDLLQSIYEQTGTPKTYTLICHPALKRRFTDFMSIVAPGTNNVALRRYNQDATANKIEWHVEIFEGDFGTVSLVSDLFMPESGRGYVLDMDLLEIRSLKAPGHQELPIDGSGRRGIIDTIFGLCVKSPLALGKFDPA